MPTGFTDFGEFSTGSLPADLTADIFSGAGTVTVEALAGSLSGNAVKFVRTSGNFQARLLWSAVTKFGTEGEVVALFRILSGETLALGQVIARGLASGDNSAGMGTMVQNDGAGFDYKSPGAALSGTGFAPPDPYRGERIWVRLQWDEGGVTANRVNVKQKMWNADVSEPGAWDDESSNVANSNSFSLADGWPGYVANLQGGSFGTILWVEAIGYSDDPAVPAPTEGDAPDHSNVRNISAEHKVVVGANVASLSAEHSLQVGEHLRTIFAEHKGVLAPARQLSAEHEGVLEVVQNLLAEHAVIVGSPMKTLHAEHALQLAPHERTLLAEHEGIIQKAKEISSEHLVPLEVLRELSAEHNIRVTDLVRTISVEHLGKLVDVRTLSAERLRVIIGDRLAPWPTRWPKGRYPGLVEYDLSPTADVRPGAVVKLDGSNEVIEAPTIPDTILGLAVEDSGEVLNAGKILVAVASDSLAYAFEGERTPVSGDVGQEYSLGKTQDGVWVVSPSTSNPRLKVVDVILDRGLYICKVLTAFQQG